MRVVRCAGVVRRGRGRAVPGGAGGAAQRAAARFALVRDGDAEPVGTVGGAGGRRRRAGFRLWGAWCWGAWFWGAWLWGAGRRAGAGVDTGTGAQRGRVADRGFGAGFGHASTDEGAGQMISVLIVDDHPVVRQGLRALLAVQDDIQVCGEAADGSAALEQASSL